MTVSYANWIRGTAEKERESRENCQSEVQYPAIARDRLDPDVNHFFNYPASPAY